MTIWLFRQNLNSSNHVLVPEYRSHVTEVFTEERPPTPEVMFSHQPSPNT